MSNQSCILCPQDFSPCSESALECACDLARTLGQPIELMHVYQLPYFPEPALGMGMALTLEGLDHLRALAAAHLEERKRLVEKAGLTATIRVEEGNPATHVAQRAKAPEVSTVVMGTHGRNALGRAFLGSVAERVLRTAPVPVVTVRSKDSSDHAALSVRREGKGAAFQKILVAYDFSAPAQRALELAFRLVRTSGGRIDILHVQPQFDAPEAWPVLGVPWPTPEQTERYTRFLEGELGKLAPGDVANCVRCAARVGDPKAVLLAQAEELGSDVIRVGATGKGAVQRSLLGSVSHSLVRHSSVPVITVP